LVKDVSGSGNYNCTWRRDPEKQNGLPIGEAKHARDMGRALTKYCYYREILHD